MDFMNILTYIALVLLIIGGLNWGLTAFDLNLVEKLSSHMVTKVVYILVALSAVYVAIQLLAKKVKVEEKEDKKSTYRSM
jgi:uncharacterized membrane protein YuzA (DUF378 family)